MSIALAYLYYKKMKKQSVKALDFKLPLIDQKLHTLNKLLKTNTKRSRFDNI